MSHEHQKPNTTSANHDIVMEEDDDIVMVEEPSPEKSSRRKSRVSHEHPTAFSRLGWIMPVSMARGLSPLYVPIPPIGYDAPAQPRRRQTNKISETDSIYKQVRQQDDDIVMVDAGGPSENHQPPSFKKSESRAKKAGLGGMLGGFLSKARPDATRKRSTAQTDDEGRGLRREGRKVKRARDAGTDGDMDATMVGAATDDDQEARRATRRARRAEREAAETAAEDARKANDERSTRRRKREGGDEIRRQEDREARRAARREARAVEEAARIAEDERAERRRARRAEKEAAAAQVNDLLSPNREKRHKSERRRSTMDAATTDDDRRDRRRHRTSETPRSSRRRVTEPDIKDYFDPRNSSRRKGNDDVIPADGDVYRSSTKHKTKRPGWPHSGTDSWVKDHSDAPPPPEDEGGPSVQAVDDTEADEETRRKLRKTRRTSRYEDDPNEDAERRRRRESRKAEKEQVRSMESGSQGRTSRRDSGFVEQVLPRATSTAGGWWSKIKGGS